jgi:hypothetical protein
MEAQPQNHTGGYERRRCYRNSAHAKAKPRFMNYIIYIRHRATRELNKMELKFNSVGQLRSFMADLPGTLELVSYERDKSVPRPKRS